MSTYLRVNHFSAGDGYLVFDSGSLRYRSFQAHVVAGKDLLSFSLEV